MIEKVIRFSSTYRWTVIFAVAGLFAGGLWALKNIPVDAIPDLSDTQVIVYSKWDQSPGIIEDQVTYPIVTALLSAPKVKTVRGLSDYGTSFVYIIFEDGTDLYYARSRVLEYMQQINLPDGVQTSIGPDATGVGWIYQYVLIDESEKMDLAQLRTYQDWTLRYQLASVDGVAEVASIGGQVLEYQVELDPTKMQAYKLGLSQVMERIRQANQETGGRMLELAGREYMIRGKGYIDSLRDLELITVGHQHDTGAPILLRNIAHVHRGPALRRGVADYNGRGDLPGGIIVMRDGENAIEVIDNVKKRIKELEPFLPEGVKIVPVYDRSNLITESIDTLKTTLTHEMVLVSLIIIILLRHLPSATTAVITIPVSIVIAFLPLYFMGVGSNLMSLAGIAISIGVLVDGAIVQVENLYTRVQQWLDGGRKENYDELRMEAMTEVSPSIFYSLLVISVSFLPIFTLVDQEGRLFKPLAYSKTAAMAIAALLAITLDPAIRMLFRRVDPYSFRPKIFNSIANTFLVGRYYKEEEHPVSRFLFRIYEPVCNWTLKHPVKTIGGFVLAAILTIPVYLFGLGREFMPPLNEGTILYMPVTLPGISISEASRVLQIQDRVLKEFPEVETVYGKAGRADTSTDPAPLAMVETVVELKPRSEWRKADRWYSFMPDWLHWMFSWLWPSRMTYDELIQEMDSKLQIPGWTNGWTMPIRGRIDMLTTGIRTPVGVKVFGRDASDVDAAAQRVEQVLGKLPNTRSAFAERIEGGLYIDFEPNRLMMSRYGVSIAEIHRVISSAIGSTAVSTVVSGRERFQVSVRYARDFRDSIADLKRALVMTESGTQVPLSLVADVRIQEGPSMIRNEDGLLASYVYIDIEGIDPGSYIERAREELNEKVKMPESTFLRFSGQYENMERVKDRLIVVVPLTLISIFILIFMNTGSWVKTGMIAFAVPFSMMGAFWLLFALDYNLSIAVWVGIIALLGLDAETGNFMLLYMDLSYKKYADQGLTATDDGKKEAIIYGAVKRIRPKVMTVATGFFGLLPLLWSDGTGADLMKRIAAPMVGGLVTSFLAELLVYPPLYLLWKRRQEPEPALYPDT